MNVIDTIKESLYNSPMKIVILRTDEKVYIESKDKTVKGGVVLDKLQEKNYVPKIGIFHVYNDEYVAI